MSDLPVRVHSLHVHPVKSCAGVEVAQALLIETGLELDRAWMVVDAQGRLLSQRELPRLTLIRPTLKTAEMILRAPGMLALHIALDTVEQPTRATLWGESFAAYDMGALSARWFSDCLGREVRLVRFDPEQHRPAGLEGTPVAEVAWHDAQPLHLTSVQALEALNRQLAQDGEAPIAMDRFRPNVVLDGLLPDGEQTLDELVFSTPEGTIRLRIVEPCVRCPVIDVDPHTGARGGAVGRALAAVHRDTPAALDEITFGSYAVVVEGVDCLLRRGMSGTATARQG